MQLTFWEWVGTGTSILGALCLAMGAAYAILGYTLFTIGSGCWYAVGVATKDRAMQALNAAFLACDFLGLYNWF